MSYQSINTSQCIAWSVGRSVLPDIFKLSYFESNLPLNILTANILFQPAVLDILVTAVPTAASVQM